MMPVIVGEKDGRILINGVKTTPKEFVFLRAYFDVEFTPDGAKFAKTFGIGSACVEAAGYDTSSPGSKSSIAWQILNKFNIKQSEILRWMQMGAVQIARSCYEGLRAEKVELAKYQGEICEERFYPDQPTRHKFVETIIKLTQYAEEHEGRTGMGGDDVYFISLPPITPREKPVETAAEVIENPLPRRQGTRGCQMANYFIRLIFILNLSCFVFDIRLNQWINSRIIALLFNESGFSLHARLNLFHSFLFR